MQFMLLGRNDQKMDVPDHNPGSSAYFFFNLAPGAARSRGANLELLNATGHPPCSGWTGAK
jgi:hypothetical protein